MRTIICSTDKRGVLTICMNRPEVHNAFDADMIRELTAVLKEADQNKAVRMVVITGSGSCFSAGADLNWMRSLVNASQEENECDAMRLADLLRQLNYLSKPTIARINGAAFGGGVGLIAACDITIAVENTFFGLTEAGWDWHLLSFHPMSCDGLARLMRDVIFSVPSVSIAKRHTTSA